MNNLSRSSYRFDNIKYGQILMVYIKVKNCYWPAKVINIETIYESPQYITLVKVEFISLPSWSTKGNLRWTLRLEKLYHGRMIPFQCVYKEKDDVLSNLCTQHLPESESTQLENAMKIATQMFQSQLKTSQMFMFLKKQSQKLRNMQSNTNYMNKNEIPGYYNEKKMMGVQNNEPIRSTNKYMYRINAYQNPHQVQSYPSQREYLSKNTHFMTNHNICQAPIRRNYSTHANNVWNAPYENNIKQNKVFKHSNKIVIQNRNFNETKNLKIDESASDNKVQQFQDHSSVVTFESGQTSSKKRDFDDFKKNSSQTSQNTNSIQSMKYPNKKRKNSEQILMDNLSRFQSVPNQKYQNSENRSSLSSKGAVKQINFNEVNIERKSINLAKNQQKIKRSQKLISKKVKNTGIKHSSTKKIQNLRQIAINQQLEVDIKYENKMELQKESSDYLIKYSDEQTSMTKPDKKQVKSLSINNHDKYKSTSLTNNKQLKYKKNSNTLKLLQQYKPTTDQLLDFTNSTVSSRTRSKYKNQNNKQVGKKIDNWNTISLKCQNKKNTKSKKQYNMTNKKVKISIQKQKQLKSDIFKNQIKDKIPTKLPTKKVESSNKQSKIEQNYNKISIINENENDNKNKNSNNNQNFIKAYFKNRKYTYLKNQNKKFQIESIFKIFSLLFNNGQLNQQKFKNKQILKSKISHNAHNIKIINAQKKQTHKLFISLMIKQETDILQAEFKEMKLKNTNKQNMMDQELMKSQQMSYEDEHKFNLQNPKNSINHMSSLISQSAKIQNKDKINDILMRNRKNQIHSIKQLIDLMRKQKINKQNKTSHAVFILEQNQSSQKQKIEQKQVIKSRRKTKTKTKSINKNAIKQSQKIKNNKIDLPVIKECLVCTKQSTIYHIILTLLSKLRLLIVKNKDINNQLSKLMIQKQQFLLKQQQKQQKINFKQQKLNTKSNKSVKITQNINNVQSINKKSFNTMKIDNNLLVNQPNNNNKISEIKQNKRQKHKYCFHQCCKQVNLQQIRVINELDESICMLIQFQDIIEQKQVDQIYVPYINKEIQQIILQLYLNNIGYKSRLNIDQRMQQQNKNKINISSIKNKQQRLQLIINQYIQNNVFTKNNNCLINKIINIFKNIIKINKSYNQNVSINKQHNVNLINTKIIKQNNYLFNINQQTFKYKPKYNQNIKLYQQYKSINFIYSNNNKINTTIQYSQPIQLPPSLQQYMFTSGYYNSQHKSNQYNHQNDSTITINNSTIKSQFSKNTQDFQQFLQNVLINQNTFNNINKQLNNSPIQIQNHIDISQPIHNQINTNKSQVQIQELLSQNIISKKQNQFYSIKKSKNINTHRFCFNNIPKFQSSTFKKQTIIDLQNPDIISNSQTQTLTFINSLYPFTKFNYTNNNNYQHQKLDIDCLKKQIIQIIDFFISQSLHQIPLKA